MSKTSLPLEPYNADVKSAAVFWWDAGEVFIEQVEIDDTEEKRRRSIVLFGREGVPALIDALRKFIGHESDCATHNEPAMPNGPCNCSLSSSE